MASIFVTGGTGFIGSNVLRHLLHSGFKDIKALHRPSSNFAKVEDIKSAIDWCEGDILDLPFLEAALEGMDIIVHCAGLVSYQKNDREALTEINVEGTANMINIALYRSVKHFIHISSTAALGRNRHEEVIDENHKWEYNNLNTSYGISKYRGEQEVWRGMAEGLTATILNPSIVLGQQSWQSGIGPMFEQVWQGLNYAPAGGNGFVAVDDVGQAVVNCLQGETTNQRILLSNENLSYQGLLGIIAESLQRPGPRKVLSPQQAKWYRRYRSTLELFGRPKSHLTKELLTNLNHHNRFDNQKSQEVLGIKYRSTKEVIQKMASQFMAEQ